MKFTFLATGLVASLLACPWIVVQEPGPTPAGQTPGARQPSVIVETIQPGQQGEDGKAPNSTGAIAVTLPQLPAVYDPKVNVPYDGSVYAPYPSNVVLGVNPNALPDVKDRQAFAQAYRAYQAASDDAARSKAAAELKVGLEKQYDAYVEAQAKQIEQLEERLQKLKEQLEKRRSAKERMVELKLQMVLSQAEGLGFPESGYPAGTVFSGDGLGRYQPSGVYPASSAYSQGFYEPVPQSVGPAVPAAPQNYPRQGLVPNRPLAPAVLPPVRETPQADNVDQSKID